MPDGLLSIRNVDTLDKETCKELTKNSEQAIVTYSEPSLEAKAVYVNFKMHLRRTRMADVVNIIEEYHDIEAQYEKAFEELEYFERKDYLIPGINNNFGIKKNSNLLFDYVCDDLNRSFNIKRKASAVKKLTDAVLAMAQLKIKLHKTFCPVSVKDFSGPVSVLPVSLQLDINSDKTVPISKEHILYKKPKRYDDKNPTKYLAQYEPEEIQEIFERIENLGPLLKEFEEIVEKTSQRDYDCIEKLAPIIEEDEEKENEEKQTEVASEDK